MIHPFGLMSLIGVVSGVLMTQCSLFSMQWKKMSRGTLSIKVSQVSLNVAALRDSIMGNQDVLIYWSIAAAQFEENEAELLLEKNHRFVDYC